MSQTRLRRPTPALLAGFRAALERGWSADNVRGAVAAQETLQRLDTEPEVFFQTTDDPQAKGPPVKLPDGSERARIPGLQRWIWDEDDSGDGFCGSIGLRWAAGGAPLPPHVLGHIGYAVVPWKQGQGHATRALGLLLPLAREQGLLQVEITTDVDNTVSQRVITSNGGVLRERFVKGAEYGSKPGLRFVIDLR
ncbi:MAG: GNAT family N-acetyltransferase [Rubrivivax sp.]|nr:GNAT family N-acetyltransferase [Rubrivivax sp.]MDP3610325.1 GNAT family N-acetyltransferase [Rubrivivax sp.]